MAFPGIELYLDLDVSWGFLLASSFRSSICNSLVSTTSVVVVVLVVVVVGVVVVVAVVVVVVVVVGFLVVLLSILCTHSLVLICNCLLLFLSSHFVSVSLLLFCSVVGVNGT